MNAMIMTAFGGPEVLRWGEWPTPQPGPGQALVKVHACSVNPIDWRIRSGQAKLFVRSRPPMILGADISGEVAALGSGVSGFAVGEPIFTKLRGDIGGYAEYVVVPADSLARRPGNLGAIDAAAVPAGATTALQALRDVGELKAGQKLLINGASGGVGLFAVQIARDMGASVTAVCSASSADLVKRLGAEEVLDYKTTDFTQLGRQWSVVFDVAANRKFSDCKRAMKPGGIYITTISSGADVVMPVLNPFRSKKRRFVIVKSSGKDLDLVRGWIEAGKVKPIIDKVFAIQDAAEAQRYIQAGRSKGKVVLNVAAPAS